MFTPRRNHLRLALAITLGMRYAHGLAASDQLSQYGRQSWATWNGLPQNTVTAITQTKDGFLWIGTEEGLARFDGYGFSVYTTQNASELKDNDVRDLWTDDNGLEVSTGSQVVRYEHGRLVQSSARKPLAAAIPALVSVHGNVRCTLADDQNVLWVGTNKGLYRVRGGVTESFPPSDVLANAAILALFKDREGTLWVGTEDAGLQMVKDQPFVTYTNDRVRCVFQDAAGTAWLGTDGAGLKRIDHGAVTTISAAGGLSSDVILSLAQDTGGALLVGTPDGLDVLHGKSISTQSSADGLPEDFVRSLFTDSDGSTWIGTRRGLAHVDHDRVTIYTESNGLGSDLVGTITRDRRGELWVGTLHGLSRFHNGSFANYTVADGLSSNIITDLYADQDDYLWIATQGGGLNRFRDEMFAHVAGSVHMPATLYGVTGDRNGNLWLAAPNGIIRIARNAFGSKDLQIALFGTGDGLRVAECSGGGHPAVWQNHAGDIWFATARGAALLTAAHAASKDVAPTVILETITVDDAPLSPDSVNQVGPEYSRLAFQYAGISLFDAQRICYRYKLDGFDSEWIEAGARRTAFYTNLGPGQYVFRVQARNARGVWSQRAALYSFRVLPHFYQTWWFRGFLWSCVLLAAYAFYLWRVKQVRSKFRAVLNERTRIAREIHDTLAQGFAGVSVQLEVVSRLLPPSPGKAREHLDQARMLARACLDDARRSIWELRSQSAEREDLATRFSELARSASQRAGIPIHFQVHGVYRSLEARVEDEILRIGQEAINNAVRHSGAQTITADVTFSASSIRLTISDNGCGMRHTGTDADEPDGHYGMTGMRERAQSIDAAFSVISQNGAGTTITVEAPVH